MFFSCATPNLATVIPAMDHIDEVLTTQATNLSLDPAIQASLGLAKKTLNRYYTLMDSLEVYRIAMGVFQLLIFIAYCLPVIAVLHPRHKLAYFKSAGWEPEWIATAEEVVRAKFERSYQFEIDGGNKEPQPTVPSKVECISDYMHAISSGKHLDS